MEMDKLIPKFKWQIARGKCVDSKNSSKTKCWQECKSTKTADGSAYWYHHIGKLLGTMSQQFYRNANIYVQQQNSS